MNKSIKATSVGSWILEFIMVMFLEYDRSNCGRKAALEVSNK